MLKTTATKAGSVHGGGERETEGERERERGRQKMGEGQMKYGGVLTEEK